MKLQRIVRKTAKLRNILGLGACVTAFGLVAPSAFAAADSQQPCSADSESRQLDFWLGTWNITYPGAPGGSTSTVKLVLDKCEIVESWEDAQGHKGENRFAYNYENKSWHGMFADNRGHVHVFIDGKVSDGSAEFSGPSRDPDGHTTLHRIRVTRASPNKVHQIWEKSSDNGATWTTVFHGEYSRKNP
jgi:hypothetical protein